MCLTTLVSYNMATQCALKSQAHSTEIGTSHGLILIAEVAADFTCCVQGLAGQLGGERWPNEREGEADSSLFL